MVPPSAKSHTPREKAIVSEPTETRSTRRTISREAEETKTPSSKRVGRSQGRSENQSNSGDVEDLLSPLESTTPLSKRTRGRTPQPQGSSLQEPKTPTSSRSRKHNPQTTAEKKSSEEEVGNSLPVSESRTPSNRKRGNAREVQDDSDDCMMSPEESKTPLSLRTPNKTSRVDKTPKTSSKTPSKSPKTPRAKSTLKTPSKVID